MQTCYVPGNLYILITNSHNNPNGMDNKIITILHMMNPGTDLKNVQIYRARKENYFYT